MSQSVLKQIAALGELTPSQLEERWRSLFGTPPPAYHRRFLLKRLAYRIQELVYGGLSEEAKARMADIAPEAGLDEDASIAGRGGRPKRKQELPVAGTRLVREWNGRRCEVTVMARGFEFEGKPYRSLTAITKAITGTHWNGRSFFGLRSSRNGGNGR
jgi:hypothetical protein